MGVIQMTHKPTFSIIWKEILQRAWRGTAQHRHAAQQPAAVQQLDAVQQPTAAQQPRLVLTSSEKVCPYVLPTFIYLVRETDRKTNARTETAIIEQTSALLGRKCSFEPAHKKMVFITHAITQCMELKKASDHEPDIWPHRLFSGWLVRMCVLRFTIHTTLILTSLF